MSGERFEDRHKLNRDDLRIAAAKTVASTERRESGKGTSADGTRCMLFPSAEEVNG